MQNLYTGGAGQAAVMSEFLFRGYNVAVPEVDRGDDLFVVQDADGSLSRIQVKSAVGKRRRLAPTYAAQVVVPLRQLSLKHTPDVTYVFILRVDQRWRDFVVVPRGDLWALHMTKGVGTATKAGGLVLTLVVDAKTVTCSGVDFSAWRDDFSRWPAIRH
jgi:hypothetical protein